MAIYDPDVPYVIGSQLSPLVEQTANLDTGSEMGFRLVAQDATNPYMIYMRVFSRTPPPGSVGQSALIVHGYTNPNPDRQFTPAKKVLIPCTDGYLGTGASVVGGGSEEAAVANPSDAKYVRISGASGYARFWFDSTTAAIRSLLADFTVEIMDVTVLYVISGPFSTQTAPVTFGLEHPATADYVMDDTITGPATTTAVTKILRSRLGELDPWYYVGINPNTNPQRFPWTRNNWSGRGLEAMAATGANAINLRVSTSAGAAGNFDIHYLALEVTYREACGMDVAGGLDLSAGVAIGDGLFVYNIPMAGYPGGWTSAYSFVPPDEGVFTVGKAHAGARSVASPNPIPITVLNQLKGLETITGVRITKSITVDSVPTMELTYQLPAMIWHDCTELDPATIAAANVNIGGNAYIGRLTPAVAYNAHNPVQMIKNSTGTYAYATFYAKRTDATDGALTINLVTVAYAPLGPTGSITVAQFDALPEIVDGWKLVTVALSPPAALVAGAVSYWYWDSGANFERVWKVLGATTNPYSLAAGLAGAATTYDGTTCYQAAYPADANADLTLMLSVEMDTVTGLAVTQSTQDLSVVDTYCSVPNPEVPTGIVYNHLAWDQINSPVVAGFDHYELQRRDTTMDTGVWETIAIPPSPATIGFDDYEARIGVATSYRIRMVHRVADLSGPWSATVASTIAVPGVTGTCVSVGLLVLTSNEDPASNLAYVHTETEEQFTFVEAGQASTTPIYGRDYQIAFRPTERGGVTFTRTILVNTAGIPTTSFDRGFTGLRDLAWEALPYVCVRDERANRWLSTLSVPSGTLKRHDRGQSHLLFTDLTITEVTATPAPYETPLPWRGLTSGASAADAPFNYARATTPDPAALATIVDIDIRVKIIPTDNALWLELEHYAAGGSWYTAQITNDGMKFTVLNPSFFPYTFFVNVPANLIQNQESWIRWTYDYDGGGAGTSKAEFWTSPDNATWTSKGSKTDTAVPLTGHDYVVVEEFESGIPAGWTPTGGTWASSSAQHHSGTKSALLTVTGSPASAYARATYPAIPYCEYSFDAWVYMAGVYATVGISIDWYDAGGALISTSTDIGAIAAGTWTQKSITAFAPATAATARIGPTITGTPTGKLVYFDELTLTGASPVGTPGDLIFHLSPGVTLLKAEIRSSIGGAIIASPDFTITPNATSVTDAQGNVWTIQTS